ncbi:MAG TPA: hypothetical protein VFJ18_06400 [Pararhizobium sp.]|nr:hypothetical protein [Pararhizobium sp.]
MTTDVTVIAEQTVVDFHRDFVSKISGLMPITLMDESSMTPTPERTATGNA